MMKYQEWRAAWIAAAGAAWIAAIGMGFVALERHRTEPGDSGNPSSRWPARSSIPLDPKRANLVLAAHPHCPCTRATIAELARLLARCQGEVSAHVLFLEPNGSHERADLWDEAEAIPGVRVHADPSGAEAARFGAVTSGHALLFDAGGDLRYSGGITGSRGHEGDNAGREAVISLATRGSSARSRMPVFGCPLFDIIDPASGDL